MLPDYKLKNQLATVLVLGATGMLGNAVYKFFIEKGIYNVFGTFNNLSNKIIDSNLIHLSLNHSNARIKDDLIKVFDYTQPDFIINCVGYIKQTNSDSDKEEVKNAFFLNAHIPSILADIVSTRFINTKVISISTDAVFDGTLSFYNEFSVTSAVGDYANSKLLGEIENKNILNIRCSVIGFSNSKNSGIINWFFNQPTSAVIKGYNNQIWSGVTTLQYAQFCNFLIENNRFLSVRNLTSIIHLSVNKPCSKFELLTVLKSAFTRDDISIVKDYAPESYTRILKSVYFPSFDMPISCAVNELLLFYKTDFTSNLFK